VSEAAEPRGTSGLVFWMLAILGGEATTTQIREGMDAEGDMLAHAAVVAKLHRLASRNPPLVAEARHGAGARPSLWRLTLEGRMLVNDCEPCGLGWPA
jgi:hypothetical protein